MTFNDAEYELIGKGSTARAIVMCKRRTGLSLDEVRAFYRGEFELPTTDLDLSRPPPGSWAEVAWMMAQMDPDPGFSWDEWKDEMKNRDWE